MPMFEFRCEECGASFEELVRRTGEEVECPKCGSAKLEKLYSRLGAVRGGSESFDSGSSCPTCSSGTCGL
jgi:putative FmdB family regulatory protein